jgi:signal transduction histidine kinase
MQAKEKKILINIDLANEVEQAVLMFDDLRIRSVILILVLNAIKFSSEGGKIEI